MTRYLNHLRELLLLEKNQSLWEPLIVGIKLNITSVICHLKHIAQPKLKAYFLKNTLENINEEVKRDNFNYAYQIYHNFLKIAIALDLDPR